MYDMRDACNVIHELRDLPYAIKIAAGQSRGLANACDASAFDDTNAVNVQYTVRGDKITMWLGCDKSQFVDMLVRSARQLHTEYTVGVEHGGEASAGCTGKFRHLQPDIET